MQIRISRAFSAAVLLLNAWTIIACDDKAPTKVFDEFVDSTAVGSFHSIVIPKPAFSETKTVMVNAGFSPFLYLGQADGKRVSLLFRFFNLPDSLEIDQARVVLIGTRWFGQSGGMISVAVHQVLENWDPSRITSQDLTAGFYDPGLVGEHTFTVSDSDTVSIAFNPDLIEHWATLPDSQNFGILIRPVMATALQQFNAFEAGNSVPKLQLFHSDTNRVNPIEVDAAADVYVAEVLRPPSPGPLYIGNTDEYKTLLRFDLSAIPKDATINRARLFLQVDSLHSFLSTNDGFAFGAETVTSEITELGVPVDSLTATQKIVALSTTLGVVDTSRVLTINMNSQMQQWISGLQTHLGIALVTRRPGRDLYRLALHSAATDSTKAPRLEIEFTVPPKN